MFCKIICTAANAIDIADIDLKMKDNGSSHQTSVYELMADEKALVLRRGSPFDLVVTFTHENYSPRQDNMKLVFHTGMSMNDSKFQLSNYLYITKVTIPVFPKAQLA